MPQGLGSPVKLLHEAVGHVCTLEVNSGETYRGKVLDVEDNWNIQLVDVTVTARDGQVSKLQRVFIRGSKVRFLIAPDMLKNAPMFSQGAAGTQRGLGRGKVGMIRAQSSARGGRRGGPGGPGGRGRN